MKRLLACYVALQVAAFLVLPALAAFTAAKVDELRAVLRALGWPV